eukprot:IDg3241t1
MYYSAQKNRTPFSEATPVYTYVDQKQAPKTKSPFRYQPFAKRYYLLVVHKAYWGCARPTPFSVWVSTPTNSGLCGTTLQLGTRYLLPLRQYKDHSISLCDGIRQISTLTKDERNFLDRRQHCCNGQCRCANSNLVQCFRRPCNMKPPCSTATKCYDNYCGGCGAEWFNKDHLPACKPKSTFG